jgi:uncharacterized membrane protein YoaK (UPF0700 family)
MAENIGGMSRRTIALIASIIVAVLIATLLVYEQIAVLYVLVTLALTVLLLIVAFADLEKVGHKNLEN